MLILFLGGKMVFMDELSAAMFITYFGLASQLIPPIKQLTTSYNNIQKELQVKKESIKFYMPII